MSKRRKKRKAGIGLVKVYYPNGTKRHVRGKVWLMMLFGRNKITEKK